MKHRHYPQFDQSEPEPLQWKWIGIGILLGGALMGLFLFLVDPRLERMTVAGYVLALSLILSGVLVGRLSPGETIRETAIVGSVLVVGGGMTASLFLDVGVPVLAWMIAPLYAAPMAMLGGWVGEMLQGTLKEAEEDEAVDWPWVVVSVVVGLALSTFSVLVGAARLGMEPTQTIWLFAFSFLVTGVMVGFFSPGRTAVEPAIAAGLMTVVNAGFVVMWFGDLPMGKILLVGFVGGVILAMIGGWVGESLQDVVAARAGRRGEGGS